MRAYLPGRGRKSGGLCSGSGRVVKGVLKRHEEDAEGEVRAGVEAPQSNTKDYDDVSWLLKCFLYKGQFVFCGEGWDLCVM